MTIRAYLMFIALSLLMSRSVLAGSATWKTNPASNDWNDSANWTPATVPNGASDTATFRSSQQTVISLSSDIELNGLVFESDAKPFTISAGARSTFTISGAGITNNSSNEQIIEATDSAQDNQPGGSVIFKNGAAAGAVTLIVDGHDQSPGNTGTIQFQDSARAGRANVVMRPNYDSGTVDIRGHNAPGLKIGSLSGRGVVYIGTKNLTVGGNGVDTNFIGAIDDDFVGGNSGRGSFTKIGKGSLTLQGNVSAYGGTTINGGELFVNSGQNHVGIDGPVQVNRGTLAGIGAIFAYGDVIVGNGTSAGAKLSPGKGPFNPGTLEIANGRLTFNALSTYECTLNRNTGRMSRVYAAAATVIIQDNVTFSFRERGTGALTAGTVFTVIGGDGLTGTFSNLSEGATLTSNGLTFKASYTGGDGDDLTLTVQ